jgi:D-sedoheptulose 7-phosphate isomerase
MTHWFQRLIERYPDLTPCRPDIERAYGLLHGCFAGGGKLLLCGNGGSAADCEHIVGELMKGFLRPRPVPDTLRQSLSALDPAAGDYLADHLQGALPAISLVSQSGLTTAFANDVAADMIFAQQVYGYGRAGDALLGISTSGNSRNVLNALEVACVQGLITVGLTGQSGGGMRGLCDVTICAPHTGVADVQERHLAIYHALCSQLEEDFFP